jgi:hypothetical protein
MMARTGSGASKLLKRYRLLESAVFAPLVLPVTNISVSERITADPKMLRFESTKARLVMLF